MGIGQSRLDLCGPDSTGRGDLCGEGEIRAAKGGREQGRSTTSANGGQVGLLALEDHAVAASLLCAAGAATSQGHDGPLVGKIVPVAAAGAVDTGEFLPGAGHRKNSNYGYGNSRNASPSPASSRTPSPQGSPRFLSRFPSLFAPKKVRKRLLHLVPRRRGGRPRQLQQVDGGGVSSASTAASVLADEIPVVPCNRYYEPAGRPLFCTGWRLPADPRLLAFSLHGPARNMAVIEKKGKRTDAPAPTSATARTLMGNGPLEVLLPNGSALPEPWRRSTPFPTIIGGWYVFRFFLSIPVEFAKQEVAKQAYYRSKSDEFQWWQAKVASGFTSRLPLNLLGKDGEKMKVVAEEAESIAGLSFGFLEGPEFSGGDYGLSAGAGDDEQGHEVGGQHLLGSALLGGLGSLTGLGRRSPRARGTAFGTIGSCSASSAGQTVSTGRSRLPISSPFFGVHNARGWSDGSVECTHDGRVFAEDSHGQHPPVQFLDDDVFAEVSEGATVELREKTAARRLATFHGLPWHFTKPHVEFSCYIPAHTRDYFLLRVVDLTSAPASSAILNACSEDADAASPLIDESLCLKLYFADPIPERTSFVPLIRVPENLAKQQGFEVKLICPRELGAAEAAFLRAADAAPGVSASKSSANGGAGATGTATTRTRTFAQHVAAGARIDRRLPLAPRSLLVWGADGQYYEESSLDADRLDVMEGPQQQRVAGASPKKGAAAAKTAQPQQSRGKMNNTSPQNQTQQQKRGHLHSPATQAQPQHSTHDALSEEWHCFLCGEKNVGFTHVGDEKGEKARVCKSCGRKSMADWLWHPQADKNRIRTRVALEEKEKRKPLLGRGTATTAGPHSTRTENYASQGPATSTAQVVQVSLTSAEDYQRRMMHADASGEADKHVHVRVFQEHSPRTKLQNTRSASSTRGGITPTATPRRSTDLKPPRTRSSAPNATGRQAGYED